ncbi:MAG: AcrB/AcrD/AcrF family protein [Planctomycetes bacterium]|nr:AcrB/AcrD/AcrF family protein [Planctomycetota bacterium]
MSEPILPPTLSNTERRILEKNGPLSWFARNSVAANLLMLMVLTGGVISMVRMRMEVFPEIDQQKIIVTVPYLGASPAEVEEGVCVRVEEALAGIDGVKRLRSTAMEGSGAVIVELEDYASMRKVLTDVEAAVDRISTFPKETEKPVISEVTNRVQVLSLVVYGQVGERTLKALADQIRDDLTTMPNISQAEVTGMRPFEVGVEISEDALRKYGMTFDQVADAVRQASLDLPGGSVKSVGGEILLRTKGQRYTGREFEDIILMSRPDGTVLRLGDVAKIQDAFADTDVSTYYDGHRAAVINIFRVGEQDAIDVARTVKKYVAEHEAMMPKGVHLDTWFDRSTYLQGRIDLLTRNAMYGLILVFVCLALFLDLKLAFWTTMGIPISFMGAFWVLSQMGMTINMISLFAFIIVLGIVVDDAIVVGENIFEHRQRGMDPIKASILGVREMAIPVTFAVLTTVVAFLPLLFTAGDIGKIVSFMPMVVISVLLISLTEALLILPSHLATPLHTGRYGPIGRLQDHVRDGFNWFVNGPYLRALAWCIRQRYLATAIGVGVMVIVFGLVAGGHIKFVFFPKIDSDNVVAVLAMPQGTPAEETRKVVERIEAAAERVRKKLDAVTPADHPTMFRHISTTVGQRPFKDLVGGAGGPSIIRTSDSHLAEVNIELLDTEHRNISSETIGAMWREEVGPIPGVSSLVFVSSFFSAGDAVNVELAHRDFDKLLAAVDVLKTKLSSFAGVTDIADSFEPGKQEIKLAITPEGRALGLTLADLARQVRQGFYGEEAQRIQRGRDDIKVMVRYPEEGRKSLADLENMRIRTAAGAEVPFRTVAEVTVGQGYAQIQRADRRRIVSVTSDVNEADGNADEINKELREKVLPQLARDFPGLTYSFEGAQREQNESMDSLKWNFVVALLGIFGLLGIQFKSYIQPLIVMSAIPFGLVGATLGHICMGLLLDGTPMPLSFLSGFGVVALTGVVVNDSLIMIDYINRARGEGVPLSQVILDSGTRRFRPIMLTTATTFCGLTPMLLERSLQARFLVPMAVSLGWGVLFSTAITLLLVPTLYMILEDLKTWIGVAAAPVEAPVNEASI